MNAPSKIDTATAVQAPPAVYSAISAVMEHMAKEGIGKDRKNEQQKYQFRGIDDVYNALCGVLAANKLMMLPFVVDREREERQTRNGGALTYTVLTVDFKIVCALDGTSDTVRTVGEAMDSADKSSNKAQSAALKYAALQVFMIPTEGDNDADATTHDVAHRGAKPSGRQRGAGKPQQDQGGNASGDQGEMPDAEWAKLAQLLKATNTPADKLLKHFNVKNLRLLDQDQYGEAIDRLNNTLADMAKQRSNGAGQSDIDADSVQFEGDRP